MPLCPCHFDKLRSALPRPVKRASNQGILDQTDRHRDRHVGLKLKKWGKKESTFEKESLINLPKNRAAACAFKRH